MNSGHNWQNYKYSTILKNSMEIIAKIKNRTTIGPGNSTLGHRSKENDILHPHIHCSAIHRP